MSEFLIHTENNNFKMKFALDTKISELKQVVSQKFNFTNQTNFYLFLEKSGFIDINSSSLDSPLSSFNSFLSKLSQPYNLFCFDITKPENNKIFCTQKITESNELSQTGIKLKDKDLIVCLSCSKFCHNILTDFIPYEELITDKSFKCQCNNCKFESFNLKNINLDTNLKDELIKNCIS